MHGVCPGRGDGFSSKTKKMRKMTNIYLDGQRIGQKQSEVNADTSD